MNHPHFISQLAFKYFSEHSPKNNLFYRGKKTAKFSALKIFSVFYSFVLYLIASTGVAVTICLTLGLAEAVAQRPSTPSTRKTDVRTISQVSVLFVNPSAGSDSGDGSNTAPLQTITKALEIAQPNSVIRLAKGTYSESTGEQFPLFLKPNVSITGEPSSGGRGIVIAGGGEFLSRAFGSKNVAIVGTNRAVLSGVTVTNNNPRGYGLWIESTNPTITGNTFTGSTQDGVAITGNSAAKVSKNNFYRNGANGITITGNSKAEIENNVFQETGFGINIASNAEPVLVGNEIKFNRSGIVTQANARPILRNNIIESSKEDGLVVISQAQPNLGDSNEAGGNQFRNNARHDINAQAAKQQIVAIGNILRADSVTGDIAIRTAPAPIARRPLRPLSPPANRANLPRKTPVQREITFTAPGLPKTPVTSPQKQTPLNTQARVNKRSNLPQVNTVQIDKNTIEFRAPSASSSQTAPLLNRASPNKPLPNQNKPNQSLPNQNKINPGESLPVLEAASPNILSVPNGNIPVSDNSDSQPVISPLDRSDRKIETPAPIANRGNPESARYRVFVEVKSVRDQDLVQYLAPGAFRRRWQGRSAMQAGVFSTREKADALVKIFENNGLRAATETQ